jgi:hypothetical protein
VKADDLGPDLVQEIAMRSLKRRNENTTQVLVGGKAKLGVIWHQASGPGVLRGRIALWRAMAEKVQIEGLRRPLPYLVKHHHRGLPAQMGKRQRTQAACFGNTGNHRSRDNAQHRRLNDRHFDSEQLDDGSGISAHFFLALV